MRIAKTQAVALLQAENAQLGMQKARCRRQVSKLQGLSFGMMDGKSVRAAEQRLQMQAAIGTAHFVFYDSLTIANSKNMSLLHALPETSPGVLDTAVAERRMEDALRQMHMLQQAMEATLERVRRANACMWEFLSQGMAEDGGLDWTPIDEGPIIEHYQALIDGQRAVAQANKMILRRASEYDRKSLEAYRGVEVSCLRQAMSSSSSFVLTGTWGDTSWVVPLRARVSMGEGQRSHVDLPRSQSVVGQFLRGELKEEGSVFDVHKQGSSVLWGIPLCGAVSGEVLGLALRLVPYGKGSRESKDKNKDSSTFGGTAELELYGAKGKLEGSYGLLAGDTELKALTGTLGASLGGSLVSGGAFSPSAEASAAAEGSVLSSQTNVSLGDDELDLHASAEGKALTAEAEAKLGASAKGVEARLGVEAYAVTGELSGGFTLLGVKVDASLEAKAAGAGAKLGGKLEASSAEGELALGYGLGLGTKVKVDWSGVTEALGLGDDWLCWWASLR